MLASELAIYEDTYQFTSLVLDVTHNFSNEFKFNLKERLVNESLDLFSYIQLANRFPEKREGYLTKYLVSLETCKVFIRLAVDKKQLNVGQQATLNEKLIKIQKQATAWKNS